MTEKVVFPMVFVGLVRSNVSNFDGGEVVFFLEYLPKGDSSETYGVLEASRCKC